MTDDEALALITETIRDVLDNDDIMVSTASTAADVPGWDSIANASIIIALERRLRKPITAQQIEGLETVGDLVNLIHVLMATSTPAQPS